MVLPDCGALNNQAAKLILRLNYVKSPGVIIELTDISKNVWINTTLINTNTSKVDDLEMWKWDLVWKRDDPVWVTSTTLEQRAQRLCKWVPTYCSNLWNDYLALLLTGMCVRFLLDTSWGETYWSRREDEWNKNTSPPFLWPSQVPTHLLCINYVKW